MTYLEAEKKKYILDTEQVKKLCPLIKDNCSPNCVCFLPSEIVTTNGDNDMDITEDEFKKVGDDNWEVIEPYCRCYFLFGRKL